MIFHRLTVGVSRDGLFDISLEDTAFPFLLFVSQAEGEAVLNDHLTATGVPVQRGVRLEEEFRADGDRVLAMLRNTDGTRQRVGARYLAGCDGAYSTVWDQARIPFLGGGYPQTFLLADLTVDGLEPDTVHAFLTGSGPLFFFPLAGPRRGAS